MPDDEPFEYLVTQAVADFLATEKKVDGIAFPSVQSGGNALNIVLFRRAADVEQVSLPPNTTVEASLGHWSADGWETDYTVTECTPEDKPAEKQEDGPLVGLPGGALRVDISTIQVHEIKAVKFTTEGSHVRRYRLSNKRDF